LSHAKQQAKRCAIYAKRNKRQLHSANKYDKFKSKIEWHPLKVVYPGSSMFDCLLVARNLHFFPLYFGICSGKHTASETMANIVHCLLN